MDVSVPVVTDGVGNADGTSRADRASRVGELRDDAPPAAAPAASRARTYAKPPPLMAALICEALCDAGRGNRRSLRSICEDMGLDARTVHEWMLADPTFKENYELARRFRYDDMAEECLDIADDRSQDDFIDQNGFRRPNKEWIARSRVRIQTRLDLLARFDPKRFGAKLELQGEINTRSLNLHFDGGDVDAAHRYADMMRGRPPG